MEVRSLEAALIRHMKAEALRSGADWSVVLRADAAAPGSRDWQNLLVLVRRALAALERELVGAGPDAGPDSPGLLARYDQWASSSGSATAWAAVPSLARRRFMGSGC